MPRNLDLPLLDLEGIGPRLSTLLSDSGLHTVGDLLRVPSATILAVTDQLASPDQARAWRQMAQFMEIPAMTPQWADALVWRGIKTLKDLSRTPYDELDAHFKAAEQANRIPTVPTPAELAAILVRATWLFQTGAFMGTILDSAGDRVPDADIRIGDYETKTDGRGRFRISRLPQREKLLMVATHANKGSVRKVVTASGVETAEVTSFTLDANSAPVRRSQVEGQKLPKFWSSFPIRSVEVPAATIAEGDLLKVILFYADGKNAKLVSKLIEFNDGESIIRWARVPIHDLPADAKLHDHYIRRGTGWKKTHIDANRLRSYKRLLRVKAQLKKLPPATTLDEQKERYRTALEELKRAKVF